MRTTHAHNTFLLKMENSSVLYNVTKMCEKKNEKTLAHAHTRAEQREQRDSKKNITTTGNNHKQQITNIQKAYTQHTQKG